jgi:hypothetical protein
MSALFGSTKPFPTLSAYVSVDISPQIFVTGRASPIQGAETNKCSDDDELGCKYGIF